jgi:hypothetical protein
MLVLRTMLLWILREAVSHLKDWERCKVLNYRRWHKLSRKLFFRIRKYQIDHLSASQALQSHIQTNILHIGPKAVLKTPEKSEYSIDYK